MSHCTQKPLIFSRQLVSVLNDIKSSRETSSAKMAGEKRGWNLHFNLSSDVISQLHREAKSPELEV